MEEWKGGVQPTPYQEMRMSDCERSTRASLAQSLDSASLLSLGAAVMLDTNHCQLSVSIHWPWGVFVIIYDYHYYQSTKGHNDS